MSAASTVRVVGYCHCARHGAAISKGRARLANRFMNDSPFGGGRTRVIRPNGLRVPQVAGAETGARGGASWKVDMKPPGQNARLRSGVKMSRRTEKETEWLWFHAPQAPAIPIAPNTLR